ncbi:hypothetical protein H4R34_000318 [Dimargaris verticillata]|uniref:GDP/GTP exchange factor Sec2 N-terminal domain-containing protein n=1 Tax=Dimargaris verticillata TaxID=2761393 RepID=A0A9W8EBE9_9FUNG|nr:hypothetical protein H4R34_000318 [Dimargaris verticillata]
MPRYECWQCGTDLTQWLDTFPAFRPLERSPPLSPTSPAPRDVLDASALQTRIAEQDFQIQRLTAEHETLQAKLSDAVDQQADSEHAAAAVQIDLDRAHAQIRELQATLDSIHQKRVLDTTQLQADMQRLAEKLIDETEKRGEVEHAKLMVENELEDLSRSLFEEANKMVKDERSRNVALEKRCRTLERKLAETDQLVQFEREQSTELKLRLEEATEDKEKETKHRRALQRELDATTKALPMSLSSTHTLDAHSPRGDLAAAFHGSTLLLGADAGSPAPQEPSRFRESLMSRGTNGSYDSTLCDNNYAADGGEAYAFRLPAKAQGPSGPLHVFMHLYLHSDDLVFQEFADFLPLRGDKVAVNSPFMKRCLAEDVEPCLRFSSTLVATSGNHLLNWRHHRRLLTAVQTSSLVIETIPYQPLATTPISPTAGTMLPSGPTTPTRPNHSGPPLSAPPSESPGLARTWSMAGYRSFFSAPSSAPLGDNAPPADTSAPGRQIRLSLTTRPLTLLPLETSSSAMPHSVPAQHSSAPGQPSPTGMPHSTVAASCSLCDTPIVAKPLLSAAKSLAASPTSHGQLVYFRYRLDDHDADLRPLCHRCRQRLRSVCDFYAYSRMITRGLLTHMGAWRVFAEVQRLRINMGLSRIGVTPLETARGTDAGTIQQVNE